MSAVTVLLNSWKVNTAKPVVLGFSGENNTKTLIVKSNQIKSDASYYLDVMSDSTPNIIVLTHTAPTEVSVSLTADMLGGSGRKQLQIREVDNGTVTKSNIFIGEVFASINAPAEFSKYPSAYEQYEEQISRLLKIVEDLENSSGGGSGSGSGTPGVDGADGKSAYEIAVENGFSGTEPEWLASLKGEKGDKGDKGDTGSKGDTGEKGADGKDGVNGKDGKDGLNGENGKSAYELAVANGFSGTLSEWLNSLKGSDGKDGKDGTKGDKGDKGDTGATGAKGDKGDTGAKGDTGESGVERQITVSNAVTSYSIKPNILYVFPEESALTISFDETGIDTSVINDFHFTFVNGSTPCELNLPESVNIGDYEPLANGVCEISIVNELMSYQNWSNE